MASVRRNLKLVEPSVNAGVCLLTQKKTWQQGIIQKAQTVIKIYENNQLKLLRNVSQIHSDHRAIASHGDSGTLVFAAQQPTGAVEELLVYGMAVGKVELPDGTSFTVASQLCDILPAIRNDPKNLELFRGYRELNLCGITYAAQQHDSGFSSAVP